MTIKALTFDIIGTVFDWLDSFTTAVPPLAAAYHASLNPGAFAENALAGYANGVAGVTASGIWTPPDTILRDSIAALLPAAAAGAEIDDFFGIWRRLTPWPDAPAALYALRNHYGLAILSNMSVVTQASLMNHAGLPFGALLSAESVRRYKPNPAVYQMAAARLGLAPNEILMVAAHDYDLNAAKSLGFRTAYVARATEGGAPESAFDFNAASFTDLAHQLGVTPVTLPEDSLPVHPAAITAQRIGGDWKIIDGTDVLLDFGAHESEAYEATDVIQHYGMDRIGFVGRPHPPMTYFTAKGSAPSGPMPGEDAIRFDLAQVRAETLSGAWIVTDGASRLLDFGTSQSNALLAVAIIRNYGFTYQCFVGRPDTPMMYFRN